MDERIFPHSDNAEKSTLGAALISEKALDDVIDILSAEDFYRDYNAKIFETVKDLYSSSSRVDILTLTEALKKKNLLSAVGDIAYIGSLSASAPSPAGAAQYAEIVKEKAILRNLIKSARLIEAEGFDDNEKAQDILERAEDYIFRISQGSQRKDFSSVKSIVEENIARITEFYESDKKLLGLSSGFVDIDKKTSGFQKQDLIILAARPSMGKTALALNIAVNAATKENAKVMIFSLEMGELPLGQRMLSVVSGVPLADIRDGKVFESKTNTDKLKDAKDRLSDMKIFVDETSGISVTEMKSKCKRLAVAEGGVDLVIVDYLQLMEMHGSRYDNRTLELAAISRALKQLAKEIECPVIVLSQLSRDSEKRSGRPVLSDLRDSGAIEQDGDLIMFIHNMSEKEAKEFNENPDHDFMYNRENMRMLLILKHRNGETGDIFLSWIGRYTRFGNAEIGKASSSVGSHAIGGDSRSEEAIAIEEPDTEDDFEAPPF